ncbi:MAG: hypothetical protein GTO55_12005, partial [Armatimonadetes bacterium]|nr:hypothetical protein [Armatimonadota bacterium]NIM24936.1 hypothetical protein [Armatimonadota bacterium]NIM68822.1 hypothetical protein [Armatimonadota bacterium]NIM77069.1 hypothetical protein [Armatimonadota bacterium]NIN07027.1 hypothetical protein [Armatimonadota bacterium]
WQPPEPVEFVSSDLGWTRQQLALPAIASMLVVGGQALSLVKPQYELGRDVGRGGTVPDEQLPAILAQVQAHCPSQLEVAGSVESAYRGSGGNREFWLYVVRRAE